MLLGALAAHGQLRLIAGSAPFAASDGYPFTVYSMSTAGDLKPELRLLSKEEGAQWVGYSYDWGLFAVVPRDPATGIVALDVRGGLRVKRCPPPPPEPGFSAMDYWLLDATGREVAVAELFVDAEAHRGYLRATSLNPSTSCGKSFSPASATDLKRPYLEGSGGLAEAVYPDSHMGPVGVGTDGKLDEWLPSGRVYFDESVTRDALAGIARPTAAIWIDTNSMLALNIGDDGKPTSFHLLVLRKSDNTWHSLPAGLGDPASSRAFGPYMAIAEAHPKTGPSDKSAGSEGWRTESTRTGPSMTPLFEKSRDIYPGRLHIYDVRNEHVYTIDTRQGDSEVLLIEDGAVYYRASDKLYSAQITDNGIGAARLVATSDIMRDVHWAFLRR